MCSALAMPCNLEFWKFINPANPDSDNFIGIRSRNLTQRSHELRSSE
jgi:hypothetical protein